MLWPYQLNLASMVVVALEATIARTFWGVTRGARLDANRRPIPRESLRMLLVAFFEVFLRVAWVPLVAGVASGVVAYQAKVRCV